MLYCTGTQCSVAHDDYEHSLDNVDILLQAWKKRSFISVRKAMKCCYVERPAHLPTPDMPQSIQRIEFLAGGTKAFVLGNLYLPLKEQEQRKLLQKCNREEPRD